MHLAISSLPEDISLEPRVISQTFRSECTPSPPKSDYVGHWGPESSLDASSPRTLNFLTVFQDVPSCPRKAKNKELRNREGHDWLASVSALRALQVEALGNLWSSFFSRVEMTDQSGLCSHSQDMVGVYSLS